MRKGLVIVVAIAIAVAVYEAARHRSAGSVGGPPGAVHSTAPNFTLQDLNGRPLQLSSYRGKVVLLNFWATWCAPCRAEIPEFERLQDSYGQQGLQVVGLSMDDGAQPVREFYQQFKVNYPVAVSNEKVAQSYGGVLGLPVSFLIGRDGRIAAKYVGAAQIPVVEQQINTLLAAKQ
jgi:peroxiredoxin